MDPILREKLEVALETEIDKAVESGTISDDTGDDASLDFAEMLERYTNEKEFIEDFGNYIWKYSFASSVGDYYMAQLQNKNAETDIDAIRKQLQTLTTS